METNTQQYKKELIKRMKQMDSTQLHKMIILSNSAAEWVIKCGNPVCATDFIGYLFSANMINEKFSTNIGCAVNVFGDFRIFSLDKKKPVMSNKKARKFYKKLLKLNFLTLDVLPFSEYELEKNLPIDSSKVNLVEEPIFLFSDMYSNMCDSGDVMSCEDGIQIKSNGITGDIEVNG